MFELLFLLLPIAAAYGWYMGNRSARQERQQQSHHLSRQYVTGLNLLLSDESDKAVDLFIDLLKVDSDTIDTHLALGNLFRSRGEVDRAIRIHQNLIARTNLTIEQRNLSLQQLAKDYMVAGFFDRAEKIFDQLVSEPEHRLSALEQLLVIHQRFRDWEKAIEVASRLVKLGETRLKPDIAHFWCELAQAQDELDKKSSDLKKALSVDKNCVRAALALAELVLQKEDIKGAIKLLEKVPEQDIDFLSEVLPKLKQAYETLNDNASWQKFLQKWLELKGGASVELYWADEIIKQQGLVEAQGFVTHQLIKNPTMKGFYRLMDYHLAEAESDRARESLSTLKGLVGEQIKMKPHYCCRQCGFSTHALFWHCPSCKSWGTIKPIRGLDGE